VPIRDAHVGAVAHRHLTGVGLDLTLDRLGLHLVSELLIFRRGRGCDVPLFLFFLPPLILQVDHSRCYS
jgi:hypothetical protein